MPQPFIKTLAIQSFPLLFARELFLQRGKFCERRIRIGRTVAVARRCAARVGPVRGAALAIALVAATLAAEIAVAATAVTIALVAIAALAVEFVAAALAVAVVVTIPALEPFAAALVVAALLRGRAFGRRSSGFARRTLAGFLE